MTHTIAPPRHLCRTPLLSLILLSLVVVNPVLAQTLPGLAIGKRVDRSYPVTDVSCSSDNGTLWFLATAPSGYIEIVGRAADESALSTFALTGFAATHIAATANDSLALMGTSTACSPCSTTVRQYSKTGSLNSAASFTVTPTSCTPREFVRGVDGNFYFITDCAFLHVYSSTGGHIQTVDLSNSAASTSTPTALAISPNGRIYCAVDDLLPSGSHAFRISSVLPNGSGRTDTSISYLPTAMAVDLSGELYLAHTPKTGQNTDTFGLYSTSGSSRVEQTLRTPAVLNVRGIAADPRCGVHLAVDSLGLGSTRTYTADNDGDGLCDSWEAFGLQVGEGFANWSPPGASVTHKDLYLEIDAMQGRVPHPGAIDSVVAQFALAPNASLMPPNPDGQAGITLHAMLSDTTLGLASFPDSLFATAGHTAQFDSLKRTFFGSSAERALANRDSIAAARNRVYRYCIFGEAVGLRGISGLAKNLGCRDLVVTLGSAGFNNQPVPGGTSEQQQGTLMHELGHAIGLLHGGADDKEFKPNQRSVMSYVWQKPSVETLSQWRLQYSPRPYNTLAESCLNEATGIGGVPGDSVRIPDPAGGPFRWVPETGAADLNGDGANTSTCAQFSGLDREPGYSILESYDEWALVKLSPAENKLNAGDFMKEMSIDTEEQMANSYCDCNGNGKADWRDIYYATSLDSNVNDIPDECEGNPITFADSVVVRAPKFGSTPHLQMSVDLRMKCRYTSLGFMSPLSVFAVVEYESGSVTLWSGTEVATQLDTLWSTTQSPSWVYSLSHSSFSGRGTIRFNVYADNSFVGQSPPIEIRSPDCDARVLGAVDKYDLETMRAGIVAGSPMSLDLNRDGSVTGADSVNVVDLMGEGVHRPITAVEPGLDRAFGDTLSLQWAPGFGDSSRVSIYLERASDPGVRAYVASNLIESGTHVFPVIPLLDGGADDYYVGILRTAGIRHIDDSNEVYTANVAGPLTIRPAKASSLAVGLGRNSAALSWVEPNQGGGQAEEYMIRRVINGTFTDANFETQGHPVTYSTEPGPVATAHCVEIDTLTQCKSYTFGIRTKDNGIWSPVSVIGGNTTCSGFQVAICDGGGLLTGGGGGDEGFRSPGLAMMGSGKTRVQETGQLPNSLLPGGLAEERLDYLRLELPPTLRDGAHQLVLRQTGGRQAEVRQLGLSVVDHAPSTVAVSTGDGVLVGTIGNALGVSGANIQNGAGLLTGTGEHRAKAGEVILVELGQSERAALLLEVRGDLRATVADSSGILVQRPGGQSGWETIQTIYPRREYAHIAVPTGGVSHLRLVFLQNYRIRTLQGLSDTAPGQLRALTSLGSVHSRLGEASDSLSLVQGDSLQLRFSQPEAEAAIRDYFLSVRGKYRVAEGEAVVGTMELTASSKETLSFALGAARPNPSKDRVVISYSLARDVHAELKIFDVAGREVRTLVSGTETAGLREAVWNAQDARGRRVRSGVYFYRLRAGDWQSERKLVVLQ